MRLVREGSDELLSGPDGGGVLRDVEVDDPPAVVGVDDTDEEDAEASGENVIVTQTTGSRLDSCEIAPCWQIPSPGMSELEFGTKPPARYKLLCPVPGGVRRFSLSQRLYCAICFCRSASDCSASSRFALDVSI